jgi:hypothetical protein
MKLKVYFDHKHVDFIHEILWALPIKISNNLSFKSLTQKTLVYILDKHMQILHYNMLILGV